MINWTAVITGVITGVLSAFLTGVLPFIVAWRWRISDKRQAEQSALSLRASELRTALAVMLSGLRQMIPGQEAGNYITARSTAIRTAADELLPSIKDAAIRNRVATLRDRCCKTKGPAEEYIADAEELMQLIEF